VSDIEKLIRQKAAKGEDLVPLRKGLSEKLKLMDKFFDKFLDEYNSRLDPEKTDTPEWKLYKSKMNEYEELDEAIETIDYYLSKASV